MSAALLVYCRPGFEKECAQEIDHYATALGISGYVRTKPDSGWLLYVPHEENGATQLYRKLNFVEFIFPRQIVHRVISVENLPERDRATPLADCAATLGLNFSAVYLETADTNEAKELSSFCRKFQPHIEKALTKRELLRNNASLPRLHIFFTDHATAWLGITDTDNSSPWAMGIPRLKSVPGAPSRSAQKLAEALQIFLTPEERAERLHEGITGVDLGASPGGWTWVLVRHGLHVTAIDNGKLAPEIMASGQVEHLHADGLTWRPRRPVHWLVCDMAEKPARVAALMADWLAEAHCEEIVFNLKLPMKKRYDEVEHCRALIAERLDTAHMPYTLAFRQLYHDREEVTGHLRRITASKSAAKRR
ncbi:MAG TPA: 23S rRNA (cytidine(2498)-2'-O)-methyltransferase RlmM [Rhodocyclaceae bacterium]|nr:23S rRNA (cytidine(2498)-2'-O)-methyltransferase RlmM [Rhodocyclaceae bacterium]